MYRDDLNPKILGQLLLMQSIVINLPNIKSIFSFVKHGLEELPGINKVSINSEQTQQDLKREPYQYFPIIQNYACYGEIAFDVRDPHLFNPYIEYISNFTFMLAVILEERKQRQIIEIHKKELEIKVNERTLELQIEKENLFESQRRYNDLLSNVALLSVMLDDKGDIIFCNNFLLHATGYSYNEIINCNWFDIFIKTDIREQVYKTFQDIMKGKLVVSNYENEIVKKNGDILIVSWNNSALYDNHKNVIGTASIGQDITQNKRDELLLLEKTKEIEAQNEEYIQINEELFNAKNKAEESDRLKTAFLQNMSHEIRTPMNAIMGFSGLLAENFNKREKLEQYSKIIEQRCNDLLDIINDILDISKIESGQSTLNIEYCNFKELFTELCSFFDKYQKRYHKEHIKLLIDQPCKESITEIKTDKVKLKQILINLITNAFKFTDSGTVKIGYCLDNHKLIFHVSDTGIGIPKDKYDFIFERFAQLNHPVSQNIGGTGLGLSIVKGLVKQMGGDVWLESDCQKGTTFYFTINYEQSELENQKPLPNNNYSDVVVWDKTILVVEDDVYNALYLKEILLDRFSSVHVVSTGNEAIQFIQRQLVDLILMDVRLPDITGYQATKVILQDHPNIKIIAQTAYAAFDEPQKALAAGCIDFISKPTKQEHLLTLLKKYV
jgi:PAS domain S-box-containing protein